jgi:hypothetical protein
MENGFKYYSAYRLNKVKPLRGFGMGNICIFLLICFPCGKSIDGLDPQSPLPSSSAGLSDLQNPGNPLILKILLQTKKDNEHIRLQNPGNSLILKILLKILLQTKEELSQNISSNIMSPFQGFTLFALSFFSIIVPTLRVYLIILNISTKIPKGCYFYSKTTGTNLTERRRRDIIVIHKMERNYFSAKSTFLTPRLRRYPDSNICNSKFKIQNSHEIDII